MHGFRERLNATAADNEAAILLQSEFFSEIDSRSKASPVVKYSLAAPVGLL